MKRKTVFVKAKVIQRRMVSSTFKAFAAKSVFFLLSYKINQKILMPLKDTTTKRKNTAKITLFIKVRRRTAAYVLLRTDRNGKRDRKVMWTEVECARPRMITTEISVTITPTLCWTEWYQASRTKTPSSHRLTERIFIRTTLKQCIKNISIYTPKIEKPLTVIIFRMWNLTLTRLLPF